MLQNLILSGTLLFLITSAYGASLPRENQARCVARKFLRANTPRVHEIRVGQTWHCVEIKRSPEDRNWKVSDIGPNYLFDEHDFGFMNRFGDPAESEYKMYSKRQGGMQTGLLSVIESELLSMSVMRVSGNQLLVEGSLLRASMPAELAQTPPSLPISVTADSRERVVDFYHMCWPNRVEADSCLE